jgi:hypothetical protein
MTIQKEQYMINGDLHRGSTTKLREAKKKNIPEHLMRAKQKDATINFLRL